MNEEETQLRDVAAMLTMCSLIIRNGLDASTLPRAFELADEFMSERLNVGHGLVSIKPTKAKRDVQK
jgi:hypothetical protein